MQVVSGLWLGVMGVFGFCEFCVFVMVHCCGLWLSSVLLLVLFVCLLRLLGFVPVCDLALLFGL